MAMQKVELKNGCVFHPTQSSEKRADRKMCIYTAYTYNLTTQNHPHTSAAPSSYNYSQKHRNKMRSHCCIRARISRGFCVCQNGRSALRCVLYAKARCFGKISRVFIAHCIYVFVYICLDLWL